MDNNQTPVPQGTYQYQQVPQGTAYQQPVPQPQQYAYMPQAPAPVGFKGSWGKLVLGFILFWVAVVGQDLAVAIAYFVSDELLAMETAYEVSSAVIALAIFAALGGWRWLKLDDRKVFQAIRDCWWLLFLDVALMCLTTFSALSDGDSLAKGWFGQVILTAIMCLGIGLSEEGLFRGLLHNSFLARFGKTRKSVVMCALMSALVFGLFHVLPADESDFTTLGVIQMILKTLQTGVCGFTWAIIATRDDDLWGVAIVHGLSDFLLIAPDIAFGWMDSALSTEYVSSDEEAMETIIVYLITIAAYLPLIVRTIKIIRKMDAPDYGAYVNPVLYAAPVAATAQGGVVMQQPQVAPVAPVYQQPYVQPTQQQPMAQPYVQPVQPAQQQPMAQPYVQPIQQPTQVPIYDPQAAALQDAPRSVSHTQAAQPYVQPAPQQQTYYPPQYPQYPQQGQGQNPAGGPPRPAGM